MGLERTCEQCGEPLPTNSRKDRKYCSSACKQAAHRAARTVKSGNVTPQTAVDSLSDSDATLIGSALFMLVGLVSGGACWVVYLIIIVWAV